MGPHVLRLTYLKNGDNMKTTEELVWEIHDAVTGIRADLSAMKTVCKATHDTVDGRIVGLHKKIVGNGQPGIEQNLATLTSRFDKLETKLIVWASVALFVGQLVAPKVSKLMGWAQ